MAGNCQLAHEIGEAPSRSLLVGCDRGGAGGVVSGSLANLGGAADPALGQFADVVEEDRLLRRVQVSRILGDLGQEGVRHQNGGFVLVAGGRIAQQGGDIDLQGTGEAIQRGEGWHSLAILDLRDIGTRNAHACGELALRQVAHVAQIADRRGHLQATLGARSGFRDERNGGFDRGLFGQQRLLAASAAIGRCAELHQLAGIATKYFALRGWDRL